MALRTFLLTLILNVCATLAVNQMIADWRNERDDPIVFYRGSQVGLGKDRHVATTNPSPEEMVKCIENWRDGDNTDENSGILNLNNALVYFGRCFCEKIMLNKRDNCKDATIDYERDDLQYRHYRKFEINKEVGAVRYFDESNLPEKKENVFIKTIINRGSKEVKSSVQMSMSTSDKVSNTMTSEIGGSVGTALDVNLGIVQFKAELEVSYSHEGSQSEEKIVTDTMSINREFVIPANSAVQIICSLNKKDLDIQWEVPVVVTGAVAVKFQFDSDAKDKEFFFVYVDQIARYFKEFSLTNDRHPKLVAFVRGRTIGTKHMNAEANPMNIPLTLSGINEDICNPLPSSRK